MVGDSLGDKIDAGLSMARFGVVVLSHAFFGKRWTRRELDGLVARETIGGKAIILPYVGAAPRRRKRRSRVSNLTLRRKRRDRGPTGTGCCGGSGVNLHIAVSR